MSLILPVKMSVTQWSLSEELPFTHLDDSSFYLALYELQNGSVHFDPDRFSSLHYNPIFCNSNVSLTQSDSLDPDINLNTGKTPCDYFTENQFNDMLLNENYSGADFSLLHLNIRSLSRNLNSLTDLLSCLDIKFSVIGISETWLSESPHSTDINGFKFLHKHRLNRVGGGVGLYVSNDLEFKLREDLSISNVDIVESLFIEVTRPREKNVVVGIVYRPPNQRVDDFVSSNNELLDKISRENKICFLMGDFNVNLMNYQHHQLTGQFLDGMYSNMFFPLITRPSRITSHTATLIDNIFVNNFFERSRSGLIFTDISDHLPVFSIHSDTVLVNRCRQNPVFIRDKNPDNIPSFIGKLESVDWSSLKDFDEPNTSYNRFLELYSGIYNGCFPLKRVTRKQRRFKKPWLTKALLKSIKRKNDLYKKYLRVPSMVNASLYKTYKNKLNHTLRLAKRLYYEKKLQDVKSNTHATWKILNEVVNRKKSKPQVNTVFRSDNLEISDPIEVANRFSSYFSSIGPNLARKIQPPPCSHKDFLSGAFRESIFFNPTTKDEIITIAQSFASGKAAGYDSIPMSIIKESIQIISEPLAHIINLSIAHGIVPDQMKIARVVPLFKAEDPSLFTNYRPVSILPSLSKFLERIIYNRILDYLTNLHILCDNQFGFRKNHSTTLALIDLHDKISSALDNSELAVGVFLDLSKAFDTVDHSILFDKLEHYGIRGLSLKWVKSYFSNRLQFVEYNGHVSSRNNISCGVPQGSILGPLFFLLYINDINNASKLLQLILFADDTNVFLSHKDADCLANILNIELNKLSIWFRANKLSLNLKKTKFMVFKPSQKRKSHDIQLLINDYKLDQVKETIFLGVILDENLNWKSEISHVANKVSKSIGIIRKSNFYLSTKSLRTLYFSLVYPYFFNCNLVWASTYKSNLLRLEILQKRVVRTIAKTDPYAHTDPIFRNLGILKFQDMHLLQLGLFMYSHQNRTLPLKFDCKFTLQKEIHSYHTRNSHLYRLPLCRTNIKQFSVFYQGPKFYNSLSTEIVNSPSSVSFKKALKAFFCNNY